MGIFDKFKKTKSKTDTTTNEVLYSEQESFSSIMSDLNTKIQELEETPAAQNIRAVVQEEALKVEQEMKIEEFEEQHQNLIKFRRELKHIKALEKLGLEYTNPKSEYMKRYEMLSRIMPQRDIDRIFLPYLVEKKSTIGVLTKDEQDEFDTIRGKTEKLEEISSATTIESYPLDYDRALIMLGVIGVLDIDEYGRIIGYDNGKQARGARGAIDTEILLHIKDMSEDLGIPAKYNREGTLSSKDIGKGTIAEQKLTEEKEATSNHIGAQIKTIDKINSKEKE